MVTFRTAIRDIYPGWLRKIPKPGWAVKGSQAVKFALKKTPLIISCLFQASAEVLQACCRFRGL